MNTFVSPYAQCPSCRFIVYDPDYKLVGTAEPCTNCGAANECRRLWPSIIAHHWVEAVNSYELQQAEDHNMLAVMLCAMSEVMMENLLTQILLHQGARSPHVDILLDSHEGRSRQALLFKQLCGKSVKESLSSMNMVDFYDAWERIARSRNKFVHGTPPGDLFKEFPTEDDLVTMRNKVLMAFRLLHNAFAV